MKLRTGFSLQTLLLVQVKGGDVLSFWGDAHALATFNSGVTAHSLGSTPEWDGNASSVIVKPDGAGRVDLREHDDLARMHGEVLHHVVYGRENGSLAALDRNLPLEIM